MKCAVRAFVLFLAVLLLPSAVLAMSQSDEIKLGRQALADLRPTGFVREPVLTQVGEALKEKVVRKELPWQFWVLEDKKELNAFALPGGFVFITRRYYEMLDGDELAFVVAHEMTHIDKSHFEQKLKRARQAQLYDILAGVIITATKAKRSWGTVADVGANAFFTKYSRKLEREADLGGYTLSREAGFDARRAVTALSKLGEDKKDPVFGTIFATHPLLSSREERLGALGKEENQPKPWRTVDKAAHPNWKPPALSKEELKNRPGLAIRVVGEAGTRWENNWREDFRRLLSREIELAGKYDVRGEERAGGEREPKLSDLQKKDRADYLLVVTVHQMEAEVAGPIGDFGADSRATIALSAALTEASTAAQTPLGDIKEHFADKVFLPIDESRLYLDMTIGQAALRASRQLAANISRSNQSLQASRR